VWNTLIRTGRVLHALPLLEASLGSFGARPSRRRPGSHAPRSAPVRSPTVAA
jgi:hypothetical protein